MCSALKPLGMHMLVNQDTRQGSNGDTSDASIQLNIDVGKSGSTSRQIYRLAKLRITCVQTFTPPMSFPTENAPSPLSQLSDLPLELLPIVFQHIPRSQDLVRLCQVSKTFNTFATPFLYQKIYVYPWHKSWKEKVLPIMARRP